MLKPKSLMIMVITVLLLLTSSVFADDSDSILVIFTSSGSAGGTGGTYIQNQSDSSQTANFRVSGKGEVNYLRITPNAPDTFTSQVGDVRTIGTGTNYGVYTYDGTCWRKWFPSFDVSSCYGLPFSVDAGSDVSIYPGQSTNLTANASGGWIPYSYDWNNDATGDWDDNPTINVSPTTTTVYNIQVRDITSAVVNDNITVNLLELPPLFARAIGGTGNDYARSIIQISDGSYIITGYTDGYGAGSQDILLIKLSESGILQWTKAIGGSGVDYGQSIIQNSVGNYVIGGYTGSFSGDNYYDFLLSEFNSSGTLQWAKTAGGISHDYGVSAIQTNDGGYAIVGNEGSFGGGGYDWYLVKFSNSLTLEWVSEVSGSGHDYPSRVIQTFDGKYVIAGNTTSYGAGGTDYFIVKLNSDGSLGWARSIGGTGEDKCRSVVQVSDSGYVMVGSTASYGAGSEDLFFVKFNNTGTLQWSKTIGGTLSDIGYSVARTNDGGCAIAGNTLSYGAGNNDLFLMKFNSAGTLQWARAVGGSTNDYGYSVTTTRDDGYAVGGYTDSYGAGLMDVFVVKFNSDGSSCRGSFFTPTVQNNSPTVNSPTPTIDHDLPTINSPTPTVASPTPTNTNCCP